MNKNLAEKTQEWKQLERKTFEQRQIADEFYERNLMKLIEEDFVFAYGRDGGYLK